VPADHYAIVTPPHVEALARRIGHLLTELESQKRGRR
jgi:hypothetical protein